jgi:hypothetical protein
VVKIIRAPICSDSADAVPREQWPLLLDERRNFCREVLPGDCRLLLFFVEDAKQNGWLGYDGREKYLRDGLQLDPRVVELALRGLELTNPKKALGLNEAAVLGEREIGIEGGKPGPGRGHKTGDNSTRFPGKGSTSRAYILARLDRDGLTELAEQVRAGELSANAAAEKAGWRKRPTPLEKIRKLLPALTSDELQSLLRELQDKCREAA